MDEFFDNQKRSLKGHGLSRAVRIQRLWALAPEAMNCPFLLVSRRKVNVVNEVNVVNKVNVVNVGERYKGVTFTT